MTSFSKGSSLHQYYEIEIEMNEFISPRTNERQRPIRASKRWHANVLYIYINLTPIVTRVKLTHFPFIQHLKKLFFFISFLRMVDTLSKIETFIFLGTSYPIDSETKANPRRRTNQFMPKKITLVLSLSLSFSTRNSEIRYE